MADLVGETGLSQTTVGQVVERMRRSGAVREVGKLSSSGGRPAAAWSLSPQAWMSAALAIEGDSLTWALYDAFGTRIGEGSRPVRADPLEEALSLSVELRTMAEAKSSGRCALAVGVPAAVKDGKVLTGDFLEAWADKDLDELFRDRSGLDAIVENDLNAIALGYLAYAAANGRKLESLAYLHFNEGSCIGSGLIVDGRVLRGASSFAGELGFLPMYDGRILEDVMYSAETKSGDYAEAVVIALRAVNCVVNPALIVLGGRGFRFDLEDEISARFRSLVDARVRPSLAFSRESAGYYLDGLAGLAAELALAGGR
jgi:predicted NBD/HSP70 family sugar kinase